MLECATFIKKAGDHERTGVSVHRASTSTATERPPLSRRGLRRHRISKACLGRHPASWSPDGIVTAPWYRTTQRRLLLASRKEGQAFPPCTPIRNGPCGLRKTVEQPRPFRWGWQHFISSRNNTRVLWLGPGRAREREFWSEPCPPPSCEDLTPCDSSAERLVADREREKERESSTAKRRPAPPADSRGGRERWSLWTCLRRPRLLLTKCLRGTGERWEALGGGYSRQSALFCLPTKTQQRQLTGPMASWEPKPGEKPSSNKEPW